MSNLLRWPNKLPAEMYPCAVDWSAMLGNATIAAATAARNAGTVVINQPMASFNTGPIQYVWLSGGTPGEQTIACTITTSDGRIFQQLIQFRITA